MLSKPGRQITSLGLDPHTNTHTPSADPSEPDPNPTNLYQKTMSDLGTRQNVPTYTNVLLLIVECGFRCSNSNTQTQPCLHFYL